LETTMRVDPATTNSELRVRLVAQLFYKQHSDNESFKKWLADAVFNTTYGKSA